MRTIHNTSLVNLLPENLKRDKDVVCACSALDKASVELLNMIKQTQILSNVDELNDTIIDYVAEMLNPPFYEVDLSIEKKREFIKNANYWNELLGTPYVVEQVLSTIFNDSKLEEFWEYGGKKHHFRVLTSEAFKNMDEYRFFIDAVNKYKNERSKLEALVLKRLVTCHSYVAVVPVVSTKYVIFI